MALSVAYRLTPLKAVLCPGNIPLPQYVRHSFENKCQVSVSADSCDDTSHNSKAWLHAATRPAIPR